MYSKRPVDYLNEIAVRHGIDREDALRIMADDSAPVTTFSAVPDRKFDTTKDKPRTYMTIEFVRNVDGDYKTEKVCGYLPDDDVVNDPLMVDFLSVNITEGGITKLMLIPRRNINTVRVYDAND